MEETLFAKAVRAAAAGLALILVSACAHNVPLTTAAQGLKVIEWSITKSEAIAGQMTPCKLIGTAKEDDRNELLNLAARRDADTVVMRKNDGFAPNWDDKESLACRYARLNRECTMGAGPHTTSRAQRSGRERCIM